MISTPINLLDASPIGDGAAALLLTTRNNLQKSFSNRKKILIKSSSSATDTLAVHDRIKPGWLDAAARSAVAAYKQADLSAENIDFFELHDAFSIMAALSLEACGFVDPGLGPSLAIQEEILPGGKLPICTMGGLKARGHPVGATGIYQIAEIVMQLRGQAGVNQLQNARTGMAQNIGGSGATVITHILQAE
jgi:acetyl-CoA C-acetyltransferase